MGGKEDVKQAKKTKKAIRFENTIAHLLDHARISIGRCDMLRGVECFAKSIVCLCDSGRWKLFVLENVNLIILVCIGLRVLAKNGANYILNKCHITEAAMLLEINVLGCIEFY